MSFQDWLLNAKIDGTDIRILPPFKTVIILSIVFALLIVAGWKGYPLI